MCFGREGAREHGILALQGLRSGGGGEGLAFRLWEGGGGIKPLGIQGPENIT